MHNWRLFKIETLIDLSEWKKEETTKENRRKEKWWRGREIINQKKREGIT